jgi:hypothetical protein
MSNDKNQYGLDRTIHPDITFQVRQKSGFGSFYAVLE